MPTYGIPNARRRAIEFVLDLGVYRRARERNSLINEMEHLRSAYRQTLARFRGRLQGSAVVLQGLDADAPTSWPQVEPRLMVAVGEDRWIGLAEYLNDLRQRLREVVERQVPTAEQASRELEERLLSDERTLERLSAATSELHERLFIDDDQIESLVRRTEALEEDRRRYQDALTLQRLGADEPAAILEGDECPACHRPLPAALAIVEVPPPMSLEQNLQFIGEQIRMFRLMQEDTERHRDIEHQRLAALHAQIDEVRKGIRAARATLISPSNSPSLAAVREQLHLEDQISSLQEIERDFAGLIEEIRPIVASIASMRELLMSLPKERLDPEDESKLSALESSLVSQLAEYGFRSFPVATIGISRDDYLPTREGFDLGFVTSASDAIRIVWSYLLGLLEVSRTFPTNHPGILMFDEPRQQAADSVSFQALLRRAATDVLTGGQIVFATSEPAESLQAFLDGMRYELITFEDMALEPMD